MIFTSKRHLLHLFPKAGHVLDCDFSTFTTCKGWYWVVIWSTVFLFSRCLLNISSSWLLKCLFISCRRFHSLFLSHLTALTCSPWCKSFIMLWDSSLARYILNTSMSVSSLSLRSLSYTFSEYTPHTILSFYILSSNVSNLQFLDMILKTVTYWSIVSVFPLTLVCNLCFHTVIFSLGVQYFWNFWKKYINFVSIVFDYGHRIEKFFTFLTNNLQQSTALLFVGSTIYGNG